MYIRIGQIGLAVTIQLMPICLATVQSYEDAEKSYLQLVLPLVTITVSPQWHDQNLGTWQLTRTYNRSASARAWRQRVESRLGSPRTQCHQPVLIPGQGWARGSHDKLTCFQSVLQWQVLDRLNK